VTQPMQTSARWALQGESIVAFVAVRPHVSMLPRSLHCLPGPTLVVAERFLDSSVGPFCTFAVGVPVRLGLRPAWHYFVSVVSSVDVRRAGRSHWGFPHQLGTLTWAVEDGTTTMRWEEQELAVVARNVRRPMPFLLPVRAAQVRNDGPVIVPEWMRGVASRARVDISCVEDGAVAFLDGSHRGLSVSGLHIRRSPARVPTGFFSTFRAPLGSPEPGVAGIARSRGRSNHRLPLN
jgi:hypothetical protein